MRKNKRYLKASFTVEITLIMPVLIVVNLVLFFLLLYMYNRGIMENALARGAKQVFYYENESNEVIEQECTQTVIKDMDKALVGVKDTEFEVRVTATNVEIIMKGRLNVPEILAPKGSIFEKMWEYEIRVKQQRINPSELILGGQQIENIWEKVETEVREYGD